ncbi:MAG: VOC family protein [candidate division Zixibacteria bacterium]|nr:VOC family protein [candidate division Zixibacteria bacterium]MDH3937058.1 VOC family protein [candidate division Zixibacteria bacterium]MDH4032539.1 VOC family protein [candidate division Zixibacteria bacterium]
MAVKHVPDGYHTVTPYLVVEGATKCIDFLKQAFNAQEVEVHSTPEGVVSHAEMRIGDSIIMMGETKPEHPSMPASIYLYLPDTDAAYKAALEAGATSVMEPADQFYGDRNAGVKDACGNLWWIGTHIEDVPPDEMARRAAEHYKKQQA